MSADAAREFVDTNILVYAFDISAGAKKDAAERLLSGLRRTGSGCINVQVRCDWWSFVRHSLQSTTATDSDPRP